MTNDFDANHPKKKYCFPNTGDTRLIVVQGDIYVGWQTPKLFLPSFSSWKKQRLRFDFI